MNYYFCDQKLKLDYHSIDLPIKDCISEVKTKLSQNNTLILSAPPGAGKSTLLPLTLLNENWLQGKRILMLEPRRLAAKNIAFRMAELLGEKAGKTVGYRIRFENCISADTRLEVITEGILTRMLQDDNELKDVGLVIFDEFHERSLFADTALALSRETQKYLRQDLRLLVMSATLDLSSLSTLLQAEVVTSKGRQYPVEIKYEGDRDLSMIPELTARVIQKAIKEQDGDILTFLPGEGEIKKCEAILKNKNKDVKIHPLYGQLSLNKQFAAIKPDREGRRKVVLATSIAETSLTIEGITTVVDSGYSRLAEFDPKSGLTKLVTKDITKDSADQRAGRAGRLSPGVCYRMWSKGSHNKLYDHRRPEIQEADLTSLALDLSKWGVENPYDLDWLTPPPKGAYEQGLDLLEQIDALENKRITKHGELIQQLPCHPRIAHMLIKAKEDGLEELATDVAAIIEERDPLEKEAGIDINLRIESLRRYRAGHFKNKAFARIEKTAQQYRQLLKTGIDNEPVDPYETGLLLVYAYPERIAHAKPGNNAQFKMANGNIVAAGHKDDLAHEAWLAVAHANAREGVGRIFLASPLNPKDLASLVKEKEQISWDTNKGGILSVVNLCIGNIILQSKPLRVEDPNRIMEVVSQTIQREGRTLLDFTKDVEQLQNRVLSLKKWDAEGAWPDFSTESLLENAKEWLSPYLTEVRKATDLKRLDVKDILYHSLSYEQQKKLEELAPEKIEVPSGSKITLRYESKGESPILAVRLQEMFGFEGTPLVFKKQIKVIIHLLSPGFKQVQITNDLRSFWQNAYFEVKKELKSRYPKHDWPDDPLNAQAIRGVKRRKG